MGGRGLEMTVKIFTKGLYYLQYYNTGSSDRKSFSLGVYGKRES